MAIYLGLGSNVGDREGHLAFALRRLDQELGVVAVSSVWETDPVGYEDQGRFLNLVARLETEAGPREILDTARGIEGERGRERTFRNAPRTLDIDILLHGGRAVSEEGLTVPHPRMHERPFVLVPLLELDAGLVDPRTGRPLDQLPAAREMQGMTRVMNGEELLHEEDR